MSKKQVAVVVVLIVLCVVAGVLIPKAGVVDALSPVGDAVNNFLHHLNEVR